MIRYGQLKNYSISSSHETSTDFRIYIIIVTTEFGLINNVECKGHDDDSTRKHNVLSESK